MHDFVDLIEEIKAKIDRGSIQNEISVRFHIVDPILQYLGRSGRTT